MPPWGCQCLCMPRIGRVEYTFITEKKALTESDPELHRWGLVHFLSSILLSELAMPKLAWLIFVYNNYFKNGYTF